MADSCKNIDSVLGKDGDERVKEKIGNLVIAMSPVHYIHNIITGNIFSCIKNIVKGSSCRVFSDTVAYDLSELGSELGGKGKFVSPDISVVCNPEYKGAYIKSYPSLVVEVLSPSTAIVDLTMKKELYAQMGVSDYLIVGRDGNIEHYTLVNGSYSLPPIILTKDISFTSSVLPGIVLTYNDIYEDVFDLSE